MNFSETVEIYRWSFKVFKRFPAARKVLMDFTCRHAFQCRIAPDFLAFLPIRSLSKEGSFMEINCLRLKLM